MDVEAYVELQKTLAASWRLGNTDGVKRVLEAADHDVLVNLLMLNIGAQATTV